MKKIFIVFGLMIAPTLVHAESAQEMVCVYENKTYTVGAVISVGEFTIQCVKKREAMDGSWYQWVKVTK